MEAISRSCLPEAAARTKRQRKATCCGVLGAASHRTTCSRSSASKLTSGLSLAMRTHISYWPQYVYLFMLHTTSGPRLFCKLTGYQTELSGGSSGQATFLHGLYRSSTAVSSNICNDYAGALVHCHAARAIVLAIYRIEVIQQLSFKAMLRGDSQDPIRRIEELHVTEISCSRLDNRCQELRNRCALCGAEIRVVIDSLPAVRTSRVSRQWIDRKSTRLNSSHLGISYAVFCLKKKKKKNSQ